MFEIGQDQAAGLRTAPLPPARVRVVLVSSLNQPVQGYELLCALATDLSVGMQAAVVVVDGCSLETDGPAPAGAPLGLLQALQDLAVAGLEHAPPGSEWLVMPGARGLQALAQTEQLAGPEIALSRLAAPFAPGVCLLVLAPAQMLAAVFGGLGARALVPLPNQAQSTVDAYSALKWLHLGGVVPVLLPMPVLEYTADYTGEPVGQGSVPMQQVLDTVVGCAQRHLGLALDVWTPTSWGSRALSSALTPSIHRAAITPFLSEHAQRAWN